VNTCANTQLIEAPRLPATRTFAGILQFDFTRLKQVNARQQLV
jgi:hypothetical protein